MELKFDLKERLPIGKCRNITNKDLKAMCRAKGIGGYSKEKKEGLIGLCCTSENKDLAERFDWIPDEDCEGVFWDNEYSPLAVFGSPERIKACYGINLLIAFKSEDAEVIDPNEWLIDKGTYEIPEAYIRKDEEKDIYVVDFKLDCSDAIERIMDELKESYKRSEIATEFTEEEVRKEALKDIFPFYMKDLIENAVNSISNPTIWAICDEPIVVGNEQEVMALAPRRF
jgi:hypothetical protein